MRRYDHKKALGLAFQNISSNTAASRGVVPMEMQETPHGMLIKRLHYEQPFAHEVEEQGLGFKRAYYDGDYTPVAHAIEDKNIDEIKPYLTANDFQTFFKNAMNDSRGYINFFSYY